MKTLVIGLGNPFLTDDGIGVKIADEVAKSLDPRLKHKVNTIELNAGGLRLMESMVGYDWVILIDALILSNGNEPGRLHKMNLDDLRKISPTQHSASPHDTTLITALDLGKFLDFPLPDQVDIFAIEVDQIYEFNTEPTPRVAAVIPAVTEAVLSAIYKEYQIV